MKNKKIFQIIMVITILIPALFLPLKVFATSDKEESQIQDISELSGVSIEQMQKDFSTVANVSKARTQEEISTYNIDFSKFVYLSDMEYDKNLSYLEWNQVKNDYSSSGSQLHLLVNGQSKVFSKGVGVDTDAKIVYNIEEYSSDFTRLVGYIGVDYRQANQTGTKVDGVDFSIETSHDGVVWNNACDIGIKLANQEAYKLDLDISGYKYIRLNALNGPKGYKSYDHAVFANIRLVQTDYNVDNETDYDGLKTVAQYDQEISQRSIEDNIKNYKSQILERELVNRIGYDNIITAARYVDGVADALDWLKRDTQALQLFIEAGGYFSGNGYNAIVALGRLYKKHSNDMNNIIYKKMLLATAAAFSKDIRSFTVNYGGNSIKNDPVDRYESFKKLYDTGQFVRKSEFDEYSMELVRAVVDAMINNDEIEWLRHYIEKKYPISSNLNNWVRYNGYGYASYVNIGYNIPKFYDQNYLEIWDNKYDFVKYGVSYGNDRLYRIWMFMEAGAICWGLSGIGKTVNEVQGIPAIGTYQPGHEAYLLYSVNSDGKGIWKISDDIAGWSKSYTRWGSTTSTEHRLMLGWGQMDYNTLNSGNNTSYTLLAQDALNNYDSYLNSMFYNLLANSYKKGSTQHELALNESLKCYNKNLDSLYGLYKSYLSNNNTTNDDWLSLAQKVSTEYRYFPAPMVDLLKLIRKQMTDVSYQIQLDMIQYDSLQLASQATSKESLQDSACRQVANDLLGNAKQFATFSFDGDHENTIMINDSYAQSTIQVRVSLDGGKTWEKFENNQEWTNSHEIKLNEEQISRINSTDDILVGLSGTTQNYCIDIKDGQPLTSSIYKNDDENVLVGDINHLEYSVDNGLTWNDYIGGITTDIRFEGDIVVKFRYKPHGVYLQGPVGQYTFHADKNNEKSQYLQLKHVSLHSFSSEQSSSSGHAAKNLIDGNANTAWHTKFSTYDEKYYSVAFDKVRYINKLTYLPGGQNGRLKAGKIYASMDGNNWTLVYEFSGLQNNESLKTIDFGKNVEAKFLKIIATENYGNSTEEGKMYFSGKMLNFYEDTTQEYIANPQIEYSETSITNKNVIATLVLPNGCSGEETEYEFEKNGTHLFNYLDVDGNKCSIEAKVTWIDKEPPTAQVSYSTNKLTNGNVVATVQNFSENDIEIISDGGYTHEFTENGEFVFKFKDKAGNIGSAVASVTWIDKQAPVIGVSYDTTTVTNKSVTATLLGVTNDDIILGDGKAYHVFTENGTHEFIVSDSAGNITKLTVNVDWIDKTKPTGKLKYSLKEWTNENVTVELNELSEDVEFIDGSQGTYTFTKNGEYTFKIKDMAGNINEYTAQVTWIDKTKPEGLSLFLFNNDDNGVVKSIQLNIGNNVEILSVNGKDSPKNLSITKNGTYTFKMRMIDTGYEFEYVVQIQCIGKGTPVLTHDGQYENILIGNNVQNDTSNDSHNEQDNTNQNVSNGASSTSSDSYKETLSTIDVNNGTSAHFNGYQQDNRVEKVEDDSYNQNNDEIDNQEKNNDIENTNSTSQDSPSQQQKSSLNKYIYYCMGIGGSVLFLIFVRYLLIKKIF